MRHLMFWEFVKNQNAFIEYIYILYLIDIQPCFGQKYIMRVKKKNSTERFLTISTVTVIKDPKPISSINMLSKYFHHF